MSVAFAPTRPRFRARHLAWLPAVLLVAWGILSAAGIPLTQNSSAVGSTATVSATVALDIHILGTCAANPTYNDPALGLAATTIGACTVQFGTNNGAVGSTLKVEHARPSGNAFCQAAVTVACAANPSFTNAPLAGGALADGAFGVRVNAAPTCNDPGTPWADTLHYGLRDSTTAPGTGDVICVQSGNTDGSYSLEFRADRAAGNTAGTYNTRADFTVEAS